MIPPYQRIANQIFASACAGDLAHGGWWSEWSKPEVVSDSSGRPKMSEVYSREFLQRLRRDQLHNRRDSETTGQ